MTLFDQGEKFRLQDAIQALELRITNMERAVSTLQATDNNDTKRKESNEEMDADDGSDWRRVPVLG